LWGENGLGSLGEVLGFRRFGHAVCPLCPVSSREKWHSAAIARPGSHGFPSEHCTGNCDAVCSLRLRRHHFLLLPGQSRVQCSFHARRSTATALLSRSVSFQGRPSRMRPARPLRNDHQLVEPTSMPTGQPGRGPSRPRATGQSQRHSGGLSPRSLAGLSQLPQSNRAAQVLSSTR
jgi:hypothetical protein